MQLHTGLNLDPPCVWFSNGNKSIQQHAFSKPGADSVVTGRDFKTAAKPVPCASSLKATISMRSNHHINWCNAGWSVRTVFLLRTNPNRGKWTWSSVRLVLGFCRSRRCYLDTFLDTWANRGAPCWCSRCGWSAHTHGEGLGCPPCTCLQVENGHTFYLRKLFVLLCGGESAGYRCTREKCCKCNRSRGKANFPILSA